MVFSDITGILNFYIKKWIVRTSAFPRRKEGIFNNFHHFILHENNFYKLYL